MKIIAILSMLFFAILYLSGWIENQLLFTVLFSMSTLVLILGSIRRKNVGDDSFEDYLRNLGDRNTRWPKP